MRPITVESGDVELDLSVVGNDGDVIREIWPSGVASYQGRARGNSAASKIDVAKNGVYDESSATNGFAPLGPMLDVELDKFKLDAGSSSVVLMVGP